MNRALSSRHVSLLFMLAAVGCLAYFYMLDRVVFSSAQFAPIFRVLIKAFDVYTAWLAVLVTIVAVLWRPSRPILQLVDHIGSHPRLVAALFVVAGAAGALGIYRNYPLCMDEYAAVFQSKIFAAGHLFAQLPPSLVDWLIVPPFNGTFIVASRTTGQAIEGYWPGFSVLLAPFEFLHLPWLCNALLAGLALYLIHDLTLLATKDRRAAGWSVLFAISSGAFIAYAISYYSMQAHLTANLLFARLLWDPTRARCAAAGLVGSVALLLHNPFPHAMFAAPWILALLANREQRRFALPLFAAYLPGLLLLAAWVLIRSRVMAAGGGPGTAAAEGGVFGWPDAALLNVRLASIMKLWVWAAPGLFIFAWLGWRDHRHDPRVKLLAGSALLTFAGYLFVKLDQGHGWGYRYFQSAWGVVPILAGCAMTARSARLPMLVPLAGCASLLSLILIVPLQLSQIRSVISGHLAQLPAPVRPGGNLFFVAPVGGSYTADMIQIDPFLRDPDLILMSRGTELDAALVRQNWPTAQRRGEYLLVKHWYLGPGDARLTDESVAGGKRYAPVYNPEMRR